MTTLDILIAIEVDVIEAQAWSPLKVFEMLDGTLAGIRALIAGEQAKQQELPGAPFSVQLAGKQQGFSTYRGTSILS